MVYLYNRVPLLINLKTKRNDLIGILLLAAGSSSRLGKNRMSVVFSGKSQQELLDEQAKQEETLARKGINIVFQSEGEYLKSAKNMQTPKGNSSFLNQKPKSSTNYLGQSSKGAIENLNINK